MKELIGVRPRLWDAAVVLMSVICFPVGSGSLLAADSGRSADNAPAAQAAQSVGWGKDKVTLRLAFPITPSRPAAATSAFSSITAAKTNTAPALRTTPTTSEEAQEGSLPIARNERNYRRPSKGK